MVCIARSRAMNSTNRLKSLERLPKGPVTKIQAQLVYKGRSGLPSIELFRALFDVSENLSGTNLNGEKKTGKSFVFNKRFSADDIVLRGKRSMFAISGVDDHVGDDAL